jgi:hypothetical protein
MHISHFEDPDLNEKHSVHTDTRGGNGRCLRNWVKQNASRKSVEKKKPIGGTVATQTRFNVLSEI